MNEPLVLAAPVQGSPRHMIEANCYAYFWDSFLAGGIAIREDQVTVLPVICWALCDVANELRLCGFVLTLKGLANTETMKHFKGYDTNDHVQSFIEEHYKQLKFEAR